MAFSGWQSMDANILHEIKQLFSKGQEAFKSGSFSEALVHFTAGFDKFRDAGNSEGMAETLYQIGMVQQKLGQFNDAIISLKEALELYRFLKKQEREAITLHAIGMLQAEVGSDEIAIKYLEDAREIYAARDDKQGIAAVQFELGNLCFKGGELAEARRFYDDASGIIKQIDGLPGLAKTHYMLALLDYVEGNIDSSMARLDEARALFQSNGDIDGQVRVLSVEGLIALKKGATKEAETAFNDCTRLVTDGYKQDPTKTGVVEKQQEVQLLLYMGSLLFQDTKYNLPDLGTTLYLKAYKYFEDAVALSEQIKYQNGKCQGLFNMGMILVDRGDKDSLLSAVNKLSGALDVAKEIRNNELIVKSLLFLGIAHRCLSRYDQAMNFLTDCVLISKRLNYAMLEVRALMEKTRIMLVYGRLDDGFSTLALAQSIVAGNPDLAVLDWEILILKGDLQQGTGALDAATETLLEARENCIRRNDKKALIKVLQQIARLDERQGFLAHAITCMAEVEAIYKAYSLFNEMSRARIDQARLIFMSGDVDRAMAMLRDEITFIRDTGIPDASALEASAKFMLFKILKHKNEIIESEDLFRELLVYFDKANKMMDLFDVFIEIAYDAIESGNVVSLKHAMDRTWKIINQSRAQLGNNERLVYFLHVYGLMYQHEGTPAGFDLARKYFGECLSLIQKTSMDDMKAVILAQLADLAVIEGKPDAMALFTEALRYFVDKAKLADAVKVHLQIAWLHDTNGNVQEALDHALQAARLFEDDLIARPKHEIVHDLKVKFHYYTRRVDVYSFLSCLYLEKYSKENDALALERALISAQFHKIYAFHEKFYAKHMFSMFSCKKLEKYLEQDEQLCKAAMMKQKTISFLVDCKTFHERILASPDANKEFTKKTIEYLVGKIKDEMAALVKIVSDTKINRAYLMECKDPGSLVPFIGFNIAKQVQKQLVKYPRIAILDHVFLASAAKVAIFLLNQDTIEVVTRDATGEFFDLIERLRIARLEENQAEILFLHRQLTPWLFPPQVKSRLVQIGVNYPFFCMDPIFGDVIPALLDEENGLSMSFTPICISNLIDFKIIMRDGTDACGEGYLDFYMLFPDLADEIASEEKDALGYFFEHHPTGGAGTRQLATMVAEPPATYKDVQELAKLSPNVVHYAGTTFLPASLPFKGHLNMSDRSFFLDDFMDLDLVNKQGLFCISSLDEVPLDLSQVLATWKVLDLSNIPNLLHASSRHGFSGQFFIYLYDRLLKGDTIGEACQNTVRYFASVPEISPFVRASHVLVANPYWRLRGKVPDADA